MEGATDNTEEALLVRIWEDIRGTADPRMSLCGRLSSVRTISPQPGRQFFVTRNATPLSKSVSGAALIVSTYSIAYLPSSWLWAPRRARKQPASSASSSLSQRAAVHPGAPEGRLSHPLPRADLGADLVPA